MLILQYFILDQVSSLEVMFLMMIGEKVRLWIYCLFSLTPQEDRKWIGRYWVTWGWYFWSSKQMVILRTSIASGMQRQHDFWKLGTIIFLISVILLSFASCLALLPLMLICLFIHSQPSKTLFSFTRIGWSPLNILLMLQKLHYHKFVIILIHFFLSSCLFLNTFLCMIHSWSAWDRNKCTA